MGIFKSRRKRKSEDRKKPKLLALLTVLLLIQGAMIIHFGQEKLWFHEDEIATFELSNLPGGFLCLTDGFMETWKTGSFFRTVLTTTEQTAFDYSIPYHNQETDVHPPLYYYVIHTASSFTPDIFSKWTGIIPNIFFVLLSTLLLFGIAGKSFGSCLPAFVTAAMWALSIGAMSMAVFIRMYSMLTFFCLLLVWLHLRIAEEPGPLRGRRLLMLLLCSALGILTQYYFLIFCFFFCGSFFFYLAFMRRWKDLWKYTAAELGAILLSVLYFPQMLCHIFFGYRGRQAFRNMAGAGEYAEHLREILTLMSRELCGGWGKRLILLLCGVMLLYILCKAVSIYRKGKSWSLSLGCSPAQIWLPAASALTVAGYTLIVARIAPYQVDRYYLCIYPLIVLLMVHITLFAGKCFIKNENLLLAVLTLSVLAVTGTGYRTQSVNYLYPEYAERAEALAAYEDVPALIVNDAFSFAPDKWMPEYGRLQAVYRCEKDDFSGLARAAATYDLSGGFLLYAVGQNGYTDEALFAEIEKYLQVGSYRLVTSAGCRVYWCVPEKA